MSEHKTGILFDMHTHSRNSHDSECEVLAMAEAAEKNGLGGFAVTDHCDIEFCEAIDLKSVITGSFADCEKAGAETDLTILKGIEMGEAIWHRDVADEILKSFDFDVVAGSVHAVRFPGYEMPYSLIDFEKMGYAGAEKYLGKYFDDMTEMIEVCDFDVLAHLTCPLRYISGKYGMNIDCGKYDDKIERILKLIIERDIALEINTSSLLTGGGCDATMPDKSIAQKYKAMGGYLVTLGSDAHIAGNSAKGFEAASDMLGEIGLEAYRYKNRKAIKCKV